MTKTITVQMSCGPGVTAPVKERWFKLRIFCPACGRRAVWAGEADESLCISCGAVFILKGEILDGRKDIPNRQRIRALKAKP